MSDNIYLLSFFAMAGTAILVVSFILLQMRNQNRIFRQAREMQESKLLHQKALLEAVITSQEAERKRIGMDLHDEVGAALSALRISVERYAESYSLDPGFAAGCRLQIDRIVDNMRTISHSLSPKISGSFGFYDAVHELCDNIARTGLIKMRIDFEEGRQPVFRTEHVAMALYRVLSELAGNTLKHAAAKNISITIEVGEDSVEVIYQDDGKGIPAGQLPVNGMGLRNIESRLDLIDATWRLSEPGQPGYSMYISVPLN